MSQFTSMATILKYAFPSGKNNGSENRPVTEDLTQLSDTDYMRRMKQLAKR